MSDPTAFLPQSTDRLPGDVSPDTYRVLFRGSFQINSTDYTLTGSWYKYTKTIDLGQYNYLIIPMFEFSASNLDEPSSIIYKCPYTETSASGSLIRSYSGYLTLGTAKAVGNTTKINLVFGATTNSNLLVYYQIMSLPSGGSSFPTP